MRVFVDTSAFYALLVASEENHKTAARVFESLAADDVTLVTSNYVVLETVALLQSRLGLPSVRAFEQDILPVVELAWVTPDVHLAAAAAHVLADRGRLSLVDCVSFRLMHDLGIVEAFAFDRHFTQQGFRLRRRAGG
jgi:predicted nucleic acid-binding protein